MRTIEFCIPFIGVGIRYAEFLLANMHATAHHPQRISVSMSVHNEADRIAILQSTIGASVKNIVLAPPYPPSMRFQGSANHSRAINMLAAQSDADIVIFSDYDMAFVASGWDTRIESILDSRQFCGVAYPPMWLSMDLPEMRWAQNVPLAKYQGKPNLSFFATTRTCLNEVFAKKLTDFDSFLSAGGLPFQIINTPQMAQIFGLPPGSILWMDTGFEIPLTAVNRNLGYATFIPLQFSQQQVFKNTRDFYDPAGPIPEQFALPEIFADGDINRPFLVHFKKGTAKAEHGSSDAFDNFKDSVNAWLAEG